MRKLFLGLVLMCSLPALAQTSLIVHSAAGYSTGTGATPVTTSAINTTGAGTHNLILICAAGASSNSSTPSDNCGNTYQLANTQNEDGDSRINAWYVIGGNTCASHTFTFSGQGPAGAVMVFSNVASGPDRQSKSLGYGPTLTSGSVTPTNADELVVSCLSGVPTGFSASMASPMNLVDSITYSGGYNGGVAVNSAYEVQTTSTTVNPTWNLVNGSNAGATVSNTFYSISAPATLTTTTTLTEGFNGSPYSVQLAANGGIGPYTWSLTSGTLPSGLSLSSAGLISGTPTVTVSATPLTFQVTDANSSTANTAGLTLTIAASALSLGAGTCTGSVLSGTQYVTFGGCTLSSSGGTSPYTYAWSTAIGYASIPPGLSLNSSTGAISGTNYGQGAYIVQFLVSDSLGTQATQNIRFNLAGNNTLGGCTLFPNNSIFHTNVSGLPVDTGAHASINSAYLSATIKPVFGSGPTGYDYTPNGIPFLVVPYNQPLVNVTTTLYQSYFTQGPWPTYAPVEDTSNFVGQDQHSIIIQTAGGGNPCELWEMWQAVPPTTGTAWADSSNAYWANLNSNTMPAQDYGTTDAAGLPLAPLLVNADEVIGTGTPTAPNGSVLHPIRFTLNHELNYYVWPATAHAGTGSCSGGYEDENHMLEQSNPPTSCTNSSPTGEIYRLMASVANPACAATSPQAAIIMQGMRNYGIIVADNGETGGLIGTPDSRWNDTDLACLSQLTLANFEPVNVSGVASNILTSYQASQATLTSISVTPSTATIAHNGLQQFTCTQNFSDTSTADCTTLAAWTGATAGLASAGVTRTIQASYGGFTASASLTVLPQPPSSTWSGIQGCQGLTIQ